MTVPAGVGAGTPNEVNGIAGYKMDLPVAAGLIFRATNGTSGLGANGENVIPERASVGLFATGLIGLGWFLRRRKREAPKI